MTNKEYSDKIRQLGRYRDIIRKLDRRTEEKKRWEDRSQHFSASIIKNESRSGGHDNIALIIETMETIERDRQLLLIEAKFERERLCSCIEALISVQSQEILEMLFVNGQSAEQYTKHTDRTLKTVNRWLRTAVEDLSSQTRYFCE